MFEDEDLALIRRQREQCELQRAPPFRRLRPAVRPIHRRHFRGRFQGCRGPVAPPLREAAVAQDQKEPTDELVGLLALRQLIIRPDERILNRVFGRVDRAQHARRVARVPVTIPFDQLGVAIAVPRKHSPHDLAIGRLGSRRGGGPQPISSAKECTLNGLVTNRLLFHCDLRYLRFGRIFTKS